MTAHSVGAGTLLFINLPHVLCDFGGVRGAVQAAILGDASRAPCMFVFNGTTYAFDGLGNGVHIEADRPAQTTGSLAGVALANYVENDFGSGNTTFNPAGACVVRDRVLYFKGPNVYFSDRNEPLTVGFTGALDANGNIAPSTANPPTGTNFSALDTRGIFLGGEELEDITAVAEVNTSADESIDPEAMAAYMLLGEPLETTAGGDVLGSLQINRLNVQAGCISQATITRTPYGTFWCGRDDVWFMPFGSLPLRVGTNIRPLIEAQPPGLLWRLHAEYADGYYRLSLFSDGQGPDLYSPVGSQFWLDLRKGPPKSAEEAQWYGPQEFIQTDAPTAASATGGAPGVWCMARDTRASGDGRLYALQSYIMLGAGAVNVFGMSFCSFDSVEGRDTCAPQAVRQYWAGTTAYGVGDVMVPRPDTASALSPTYVCTTGGTSGSGAEPNWLAPAAGVITDGSVVWTAVYWTGTILLSGYVPNLQQGANQVLWSIVSKEMMLGDVMTEKLLDGEELGYWASDRTRVTSNSHQKQDVRHHVLGMANDQTAENVLDSTTGDRVWQSAALTPSPTSRFRGKSATWECGQDAGIVITAGINDTVTGACPTGISGTIFSVTIPAGYYATILDVAHAVGVAIQAAVPDTVALSGTSYAVLGFANASGGGFEFDAQQKLLRLLGFVEEQSLNASGSNAVYGSESPRYATAPDMQISGINIRYKEFKRRPS